MRSAEQNFGFEDRFDHRGGTLEPFHLSYGRRLRSTLPKGAGRTEFGGQTTFGAAGRLGNSSGFPGGSKSRNDWSYGKRQQSKPEKLPSVKNDLEALFSKVTATTQKAQMLAGDRTRNKAQQRMAAHELAVQLFSDLRRHAEIFGKKANELKDDGQAVADEILGPRDNYGYLQSEIRGWIRDQIKTPERM